MPNKKDSHDSNKVDAVLLLLVSGLSQADLETAAVDKLDIAPSDVENVIEAARQKLKAAADYDQRERLGEALTRLDDVYRRAIKVQDMRTALQAQKELNRLLDLAGVSKARATDDAADDGIESVEQMLLAARVNIEDFAAA